MFRPVGQIVSLLVAVFIGGRCFSASHMALSSARVMGTGATLGQAAGTAVAIACRENITPREVGNYIEELQQTLLRDDCYIPGIKTVDEEDLVANLNPIITASSAMEGGLPTNINGDYARRIDEKEYAWISESMSDDGEFIQLDFGQEISASSMVLRFDPNFSKTTIITQSSRKMANQVPEMPYELVRDYTLVFEKEGMVVKTIEISDNFQRVNKFEFKESVKFDQVKVVVNSTYGDECARIFNIRIYK